MLLLFLLLILVVVVDLAALRYGVTSTDGLDSPEWELRQLWYGFH